MESPDLIIRLQPKQQRLYQLMSGRPTVLGFGGSRGGAKSGGARRVLLRRRLDYPGTIGMIFRRTYPDLLDNHIQAMWRDFPSLEKYYNKGEKTIHLPNDSKLMFRYAENEEDVKSFLGKEYMDVYADQAEALSEIEISYLRSTVRWPNVPINQCNLILGFNPGGQGAMYLKRIFIDGPKDPKKHYKPDEDPEDYAFIQSYGWDNIEWVRQYLEKNGVSERQYYKEWTEPQRRSCFLDHSAYGRVMNSMPKSLRDGWLEGSFTSFAGQYFPNFSPNVHVKPNNELGIEPWHERWVSIDWGFAHNTAVYWGAKTPDHVAVYRELVVNRTEEQDIARAIVKLSKGEDISVVYISPDANQKRGSSKPISEQIGDLLVEGGVPYPETADNARIDGWRLIYNMLTGEGGRPKLLISDSCTRLIQCLPSMVRDPKNIEDCEKFKCNDQGEGGDDPADSLRYLLKSYFRDRSEPLESRMEKEVALLAQRYMSVSDLSQLNTARNILGMKFAEQRKRHASALGRPVRLH